MIYALYLIHFHIAIYVKLTSWRDNADWRTNRLMQSYSNTHTTHIVYTHAIPTKYTHLFAYSTVTHYICY